VEAKFGQRWVWKARKNYTGYKGVECIENSWITCWTRDIKFSNNGDGQWEGKKGLVGIIAIIVPISPYLKSNLTIQISELKFGIQSVCKTETKYADMTFTFTLEV